MIGPTRLVMKAIGSWTCEKNPFIGALGRAEFVERLADIV
jgi:hypothetical protein